MCVCVCVCMCVGSVCVYIYIYIYMYVCVYIYIYIYCHPQTDCLVVSKLFSGARHVGCLKLRLKPIHLYVRISILPHNQQATHPILQIIRHYVVAFVCLHFVLLDTRVLNSLEELLAAINSFARVLNPQLREHIYCHSQTECVCVNIYIYIYIYIYVCV